MGQAARYPLQGMLEKLADSKGVKLSKMSPKQLKESKMPLDEYFQGEFNKLDLGISNERPLILIARNQEQSLSYLGMTLELAPGRENSNPLYCQKGVVVAENRDRTLVLDATKYGEESGFYGRKTKGGIYCQLVDRMLLRLLPTEFKKKSGHIGIYDLNLELSQINLNHLRKLLKGLF